MNVELGKAMGATAKAARVARGWSQAELAVVLGVSRQTVNNVETGRVIASLPLALAVARVFGGDCQASMLVPI